MSPTIVIVAGPNGAGKTTVGMRLVREKLGIGQFANADDIARGLNVFAPGEVAGEAARVMLGRLKELGRQRVDFGFETTLASRSFAPWLRTLIEDGYQFHLFYLTLAAPEVAISRVAERVRAGGHHVLDDVVRRRFHRGIQNFFELYAPLAATWEVLDNTYGGGPESIACKSASESDPVILNEEKWKHFEGFYNE